MAAVQHEAVESGSQCIMAETADGHIERESGKRLKRDHGNQGVVVGSAESFVEEMFGTPPKIAAEPEDLETIMVRKKTRAGAKRKVKRQERGADYRSIDPMCHRIHIPMIATRRSLAEASWRRSGWQDWTEGQSSASSSQWQQPPPPHPSASSAPPPPQLPPPPPKPPPPPHKKVKLPDAGDSHSTVDIASHFDCRQS
jgi:hypothetical protein